MSPLPGPRRVVVTESDGPGRTLAARLAGAGVEVRLLPVVAGIMMILGFLLIQRILNVEV